MQRAIGPVIDGQGTEVATRYDAPLPVANGGLLSAVERIMNDPNVSIERVNAAFDFYQRARDDQAKRDFMAALSACQAEMETVSRDATNPQTRSRYVTFAALDRALRPIYTRHGFALSFDTADSPKPDHVRVVCHLSHSAGHERTYTFDAACDGRGAKGNSMMTTIHAEGSALSYGRRYLESAIFNIASEDDDGNAASRRPTPRQEPDEMVPAQSVNYDDATISAALVEELATLIAKSGANIDRLLKFANAGSLPEIRASEFGRIKALLLRKAAEAANG